MKHYLRGCQVLWSACVLWAQLAAAQESVPTLQTHLVNGIRVHLVNTHEGNRVVLATSVHGGSWFDEPKRHAGLSHLGEHVIHAGSKKFPGATTFNERAAAIGGSTNALTYANRVYYYFETHPSALEDAAALQGAMISDPEWDPETFVGERAIVMNEAQEYMAQDDTALEAVLFLEALPADHPLRMYDVGTQAQLSAVTLDDLRELYQRVFTAEGLQIIVAGNFDPGTDSNGHPNLSVQKVLSTLGLHYRAQPASDPADTAPNKISPVRQTFPPLRDGSPQVPFVAVGTSAPHAKLTLRFQIPDGLYAANREAAEELADFLNLEGPNTLSELMRSKGWATDVSAFVQTANNLALFGIRLDLSEYGAKLAVQNQDIVNFVMAALNRLASQDLPAETLAFLADQNIVGRQNIMGVPERMADALASWLIDHPSARDGREAFDFEKRYRAVTAATVRELAEATFQPGQMMVGMVSPAITGPERQMEFGRPLRKTSLKFDREVFGKMEVPSAFGTLQATPKFSRQPRAALATQPTVAAKRLPEVTADMDGFKVATETLSNSDRGALQLRWTLGRASTRALAAQTLAHLAIDTHFAQSWSLLSRYGVSISFSNGVHPPIQSLGLSGPSDLLPQVADHYRAQLADLSWLTDQDVSEAYQQWSQIVREGAQGFTATQATEHADILLNNWGMSDATLLAQAAQLRTAQQIREYWNGMLLERADLQVAAVGNFDHQKIVDWARTWHPRASRALTPAERSELSKVFLRPVSPISAWTRLDPSKDKEAFGLVRFFSWAREGGPNNWEDVANSYVLGSVVGEQVNNLNRVGRNLGYIHSASTYSRGALGGFRFYGQTEGWNNVVSTRDGWARVMDRWLHGEVSQAEFDSIKQGLVRTLDIENMNRWQRVRELMGMLTDNKVPDFTARFDAAVRATTLESVTARAQSIFDGMPALDVVASRKMPECEEYFTRAADVRKWTAP